MSHTEKFALLGRDYESRGEVYVRAVDALNAALGTSPGVTAKPNEDAACLYAFDSQLVLAVADGHWGREASEIAISRTLELLGPESHFIGWNETEIQARLFSLFDLVNTELFSLAKSASATPETTLIVCHVREAENGKYMCWSSFGDSYLFLLRKRQLNQLNTPQPRWLGYLSKLSEDEAARAILVKALSNEARYVGVAGGLDAGIERLLPGDILLLCTDGLVGSDRERYSSVMNGLRESLSSDRPVGSKVENLIASALARGEKDNISCAVAGILE